MEWDGPRKNHGSPVSDDGRGLKLVVLNEHEAPLRGSPVSDDGRGLKLKERKKKLKEAEGSPVSDDGRGLKLVTNQGFDISN